MVLEELVDDIARHMAYTGPDAPMSKEDWDKYYSDFQEEYRARVRTTLSLFVELGGKLG